MSEQIEEQRAEQEKQPEQKEQKKVQAGSAEHSKTQTKQKQEHKKLEDKGTLKLRKKFWYPILAPKMFDEIPIGETTVYEQKAMVGKTIVQNLMSLTNDTKRQNINVKLVIDSVENNKAKTKIVAFEMVPATVKRVVRRASNKLDFSFVCTTSDGIRMRIKPLIVTKAETKHSILAKIQHNTVNFIIKRIEKGNYEDTIMDLITYKIQNSLREHLNKLYPLRTCDIRYAGIDEIKKPAEQ